MPTVHGNNTSYRKIFANKSLVGSTSVMCSCSAACTTQFGVSGSLVSGCFFDQHTNNLLSKLTSAHYFSIASQTVQNHPYPTMKVAALFTAFAATANAFAPATPVGHSTASSSALSMGMERTYIMVRLHVNYCVTTAIQRVSMQKTYVTDFLVCSFRKNITQQTCIYRSSQTVFSVVLLEILSPDLRPRDTIFRP